MEYMILIYNDERSYGSATEAQLKAMYQEYGAYTQDLIKAGVMRAGSELKPVATATTVRVRGGKVLTTDGPFAETKEQLGGYYLIDVPNLDEAVKWGSKCPGAKTGSIEVRPLNPHS
ncbi:MAG TPA: YciI family protein [Burkholderiales bacterium]|nr:YciI family protein [Burkholderiales bacterium]